MKIAFLPIDNRPVCYTLPILMSEIDKSISLSIPERNLLGDLTKCANIEKLFEWLENLPKQDAIILSLDTLCYGGLIPSRRSKDSFDDLVKRLNRLKEILLKQQCKIYAFSSIMRISNNNYNEEEKEYWSKYGKAIFQYSYNLDKTGITGNEHLEIPDEILNDYLQTRKRNFEINKIYLDWQKEKIFDTLIFSKDDCAEYGLNVKESRILSSLGGYLKTGADEIPLSLLSRAIQGEIKVYVEFLEPEYQNLISNYEDVSIKNSVYSQLELANCNIVDKENCDIILYVNNFKCHQGEIVMKVSTESFDKNFLTPQKPYMVADVRFANGSDNKFIEELFKNNITDKYFFGFSAWNTSANTLGSLICGAKIKFLAQKYNKKAFSKLSVTRFLDDWAYQANVRQQLNNTDLKLLKEKMENFENKLKEKFDMPNDIEYTFPWHRLFEVEIEFN